jgi:hypothetical protein
MFLISQPSWIYIYFILKLHCEILMVPLNKKLYNYHYLSSSNIFSIYLTDPQMYRSIWRQTYHNVTDKNDNVSCEDLDRHYTFIACWWGKYENLFTHEYHIALGRCPQGIWYSWVNKFSYFLNPHAINVLLYRMKPRKHIHVKYCWQTYIKSIGTLSQTFKNHIHNNIVTVACKWCVPSASDVFLSKNDNSGGKNREASEGAEYDIYFMECDHVFWLLPIVQSN